MKINVIVHPNSKKGPLLVKTSSNFVAYVRQPASQNKANLATIKLLSEYFKIPKSKIKLVFGSKSKDKTFEILDVL